MKTILEILIILKHFRKENPSSSNGLCLDISRMKCCRLILLREKQEFTRWLDAQAKIQRIFFGFQGRPCHDPNMFMWPPNDQAARNEWLDNQISLLSSEKIIKKK